jgi:hypothetical protein
MPKVIVKTEAARKAEDVLINAIRKDGEGKKVGNRPTYFESTGIRLYEPLPNTLREIKCKAAKEGVFTMESTDQQVDAHFLDGKVVVAHNGYERHKVYEEMKLLKC